MSCLPFPPQAAWLTCAVTWSVTSGVLLEMSQRREAAKRAKLLGVRESHAAAASEPTLGAKAVAGLTAGLFSLRSTAEEVELEELIEILKSAGERVAVLTALGRFNDADALKRTAEVLTCLQLARLQQFRLAYLRAGNAAAAAGVVGTIRSLEKLFQTSKLERLEAHHMDDSPEAAAAAAKAAAVIAKAGGATREEAAAAAAAAAAPKKGLSLISFLFLASATVLVIALGFLQPNTTPSPPSAVRFYTRRQRAMLVSLSLSSAAYFWLTRALAAAADAVSHAPQLAAAAGAAQPAAAAPAAAPAPAQPGPTVAAAPRAAAAAAVARPPAPARGGAHLLRRRAVVRAFLRRILQPTANLRVRPSGRLLRRAGAPSRLRVGVRPRRRRRRSRPHRRSRPQLNLLA